MLYAARECARVIQEEGREAVIERHRVAGAAMLAGVQALGFVVFGDTTHKMNNVVGVEIPAGVPGDEARARMLQNYGIEIGTSFGPLHGRIWRIGTMGDNARREAVIETLGALEEVLRSYSVAVAKNAGMDAAEDVFRLAR